MTQRKELALASSIPTPSPPSRSPFFSSKHKTNQRVGKDSRGSVSVSAARAGSGSGSAVRGTAVGNDEQSLSVTTSFNNTANNTNNSAHPASVNLVKDDSSGTNSSYVRVTGNGSGGCCSVDDDTTPCVEEPVTVIGTCVSTVTGAVTGAVSTGTGADKTCKVVVQGQSFHGNNSNQHQSIFGEGKYYTSLFCTILRSAALHYTALKLI